APRRQYVRKVASAIRLERPVNVAREGVLWRYAIALGAMHLLALVAVLPWLFSWTGVAVFGVGVIVFGQGVNLGYHRLLAHNSLSLLKWLEHGFVVLALCSMQDTPVKWITAHRHHHKFSDVQCDAHSPLAGFLWSHVGWLIRRNATIRGPLAYQSYAHDLL